MFKNLYLKILALLSAIIFWTIIISLENTFYIFPEPLEIQTFNLPENLVLEKELPESKITIQVSPQDVKKLTPKDFEVYIDLKNATPGERQAEVSVTSKNALAQVVKVEPSIVKVSLEEIKEKTVPITYKTKGNPEENYQVEEVKFDSDKIVVKGNQDGLSKLSEVQAVIVLAGGETETFEQQATLQPIDSEGNLLEDLTPELEEIEATVVIQQGIRTKTVGIEPVITGELTSAWLQNLRITPTNIRIQGSNSLISGITNIKTAPIDINAFLTQQTISISLELPQSVQLAPGSPRQVNVTADIQTIEVEQPPEEPEPKPSPPESKDKKDKKD